MKLDVVYEDGKVVSVRTIKDEEDTPAGEVVEGNPAEIVIS